LPVALRCGVVKHRQHALDAPCFCAHGQRPPPARVDGLPDRDSWYRPVESLQSKEIDMKKLLACLMLACFALGSSAGFAQVPDKCKNLTGDAQKKCIDDEKKMKK
jgi:hypothetical protein